MARVAYARNTTRVLTGTYPDDGTSPVGTNEWNADPESTGLFGFTKIGATLDTNGILSTKDDSATFTNEGGSSQEKQSTVIEVECYASLTTDAVDKISITDTNENDIVYLFKGTNGDTVTVSHTGSLASAGQIQTLDAGSATLNDAGKPISLIRRGDYWFEFGGGGASTPTDITVADESSDTTCFPLYATAATGDLEPKSGSNLTFNSSSGLLTSTLFAGALTGNVTGDASGTAGIATNVTVADESSDTSCNVLFTTAATGNLPPKSGTNLTFNSNSGLLTATLFAGDLTGAVTGNADTATSATTATNVTVADESSDTSCNVLFTTAETGNLPPKSGTNLTFNSSSGLLTSTSFAGALTGNVTGNADTVTTNANLTGEVTSSGNTATIANDIIQEGNLQAEAAPTNDYVLTAKSSATGGFTWAAAAGGFVATADDHLDMTGAFAIRDVDLLFLEHKSSTYISGGSAASADIADQSQLFVEQIDSNNDALYVRLRLNGSTQNVRLA